MVKALVMLIPPLGHDPQFYGPLAKEVESDIALCLPNYPYQDDFNALPSESILESLATHFMGELEAYKTQHPHAAVVAIGGVSLGATLSIRMNHRLEQKPNRLLLMAPGGLKVSNARKNMIRMVMNNSGPVEFLKQSLAIDGDTFQESSFGHQFCSVSQAVVDYWNYYSQQLWDLRTEPQRAESFVRMINAALEVNYEQHIAEESANYSIIWSEKDKVFSPRMLKKFRALASEAEFHVLENIGHYAPLEAPALIASMIKQCCRI